MGVGKRRTISTANKDSLALRRRDKVWINAEETTVQINDPILRNIVTVNGNKAEYHEIKTTCPLESKKRKRKQNQCLHQQQKARSSCA